MHSQEEGIRRSGTAEEERGVTSEERVKSFCVGLGYFAGSIAEAGLSAILDEHAEEVVAKRDTETCAWEYSDPDYNEWSSTCGASFRFDEGTVLENKMKFCMGCGKIVVETINPNIDYENDEWKE